MDRRDVNQVRKQSVYKRLNKSESFLSMKVSDFEGKKMIRIDLFNSQFLTNP